MCRRPWTPIQRNPAVSTFTAKGELNGLPGSATGRVQFKTLNAEGEALSQLHGTVVCIGDSGGGYEIRFEVVTSSGSDTPDNALAGLHGSIFVWDIPAGDMSDENFNPGFFGNDACGNVFAGGEDLLKGDIKVRLWT